MIMMHEIFDLDKTINKDNLYMTFSYVESTIRYPDLDRLVTYLVNTQNIQVVLYNYKSSAILA